MGLSLLYYDFLKPGGTANPATLDERFETVRGLMQDALSDIRNISADIAPPHLERLSPVEAMELAIRNHEKRTGVAVVNKIDQLAFDLPVSLKTCIYRFVQEGLNNAFRHAEGATTTVLARLERDALTIEVSDCGAGFVPGNSLPPSGLGLAPSGLGLAGLRDRIEACDGQLDILSILGQGTRLIATFIPETQRGD